MTTKTPKLPVPALALLLVPAMLLPLRHSLLRLHQPDLLLGLSSDFYAGVTIGIAICTGAVGLAMLVNSLAAAKP